MIKVMVMATPYYDNTRLIPVGEVFEAPDNFDFGRMGNFGKVDEKGNVSVPRVAVAPEAVKAREAVKYEWSAAAPPGDAPIFPATAGVKVAASPGSPASGAPPKK